MTQEQLRKLPKIDLHCHLDGSLSLECVRELLGRSVTMEELQAEDDCDSLKTYLEKFDLPVSALQTEDGLRRAAYDVVKSVSEENVRYLEIRFAPLLSVNKHLDCERVIGAVIEGLEQGQRDFPVKAQVIACAMRHHPQEESLAMFHAAKSFLGRGLCALDLAGDEAAFPMKQFENLFRQAADMGFPFTLHAGECGSVENVLDSIACGAARIGHGIALSGYEDGIKLCREQKIGLEMCPVSNLQTKAVKRKEDYPIREFLDAGLCVTINTDNRTVSNTTLTREFGWIQSQYGITDEEIRQIERNALEVSFAPEAWKQQLRREF
ncbi:MAG: adenosine deaminase [Lachnospiraceae bacterium]|nr:adenosine deaminase [Lachnospiraceae bacterium]MDY4971256.1 adenosine deaminase [Lachnospiraceae bacterium]